MHAAKFIRQKTTRSHAVQVRIFNGAQKSRTALVTGIALSKVMEQAGAPGTLGE